MNIGSFVSLDNLSLLSCAKLLEGIFSSYWMCLFLVAMTILVGTVF